MQRAHFQESILKVSARNQIKIKKFCQPLLDIFSVHYFYYFKVTYDGYYSLITNNLKLNEFFFGTDLHHNWPYFRDPSLFKNEIKFFTDENDSIYAPTIDAVKKSFNVNPCLQLLNKTATGMEGLGFATDKNIHSISHIFMNELNLFFLFTQRFKENFSKELGELENYQVNIKEELGLSFFEKNRDSYLLARDDFVERMGIKKLSLREKQVMEHLLKCHSVCEIAQKLSLSSRTIETYMENLKNKLDCHTKAELIEKTRFLASIHPFN